ncbi:MAG: SDR family oxidoreductase [Ignavibacteria bacterium]|nr:SDR family oxidoreductase [Ignavibacteria bacterium]
MKSESKVIWVTGGSSGIGQAIAKNFAKINCKVYISSRRNTELERTAKQFSKEKLKVHPLPCNVASETNVSAVAKQIFRESDKIDCLVNCAGITSFKDAIDSSNREIKDIVNTNLLGSIFCMKAVLPDMMKKKSGLVINISSIAAEKIYTGSAAYSASKAGIVVFSKVVREEIRESGVKIVNVLPGPTETQMWSQQQRKESSHLMMKPDDLAHIIVSIFLQPDDVVTEEILIRPITGDIKI